MTLRELINQCNYKSVFNIIYKSHYSKEEKGKVLKADLSFLSAWNILSELNKNPVNECEIHLISITTDDSDIIDVCYYSSIEDEFYALDFIPWSDLIDLEVKSGISSPAEILAHVLWEITFWGFSPDEIENESNKIKKQV